MATPFRFPLYGTQSMGYPLARWTPPPRAYGPGRPNPTDPNQTPPIIPIELPTNAGGYRKLSGPLFPRTDTGPLPVLRPTLRQYPTRSALDIYDPTKRLQLPAMPALPRMYGMSRGADLGGLVNPLPPLVGSGRGPRSPWTPAVF